jgi:hypothetical protein
MSWLDTSKEFYSEFGDYFVCAYWNGKTGGPSETHFISPNTPPLREFRLLTIWPDRAQLFTSEDAAQACLDTENSLRPGLFDDWKVARLADLEALFGQAPHPAIAMIGGREPEHPEVATAEALPTLPSP